MKQESIEQRIARLRRERQRRLLDRVVSYFEDTLRVKPGIVRNINETLKGKVWS